MEENVCGKVNINEKLIDEKFLLPEVRCGFYIPTTMKQAWAADLKVLDVVDRICRKHNISYFADWGTLLGTVRHAGFIPWDDDLDICMKREDYTLFCEVAAKELPDDFCMHTYETQEDFWNLLSRVVNNSRICFEPEHLRKFNGFPYLASVDIFVLDYMYADEKKEQARREKLLYLLAVGEEIVAKKRHARDSAITQNLDEAEKRLGRKIPRSADDRQQLIYIYRVVEEEFASVPVAERGNLTQMMPWGLKGSQFSLPKEYYERAIRLPYENTTMPVPYAFDAMLKKRYGQYLNIVKNAGGHDYPFFEGQKSALQEVLDFEIPEYKFDKESLQDNTEVRNQINDNCAKAVIAEALSGLYAAARECNASSDAHALSEEELQLIVDAQQTALDIGNYIEEIWGSDFRIIPIIESFCENIYEMYEKQTGDVFGLICEFVDKIERDFLQANEVIFLCDSKEHLEAVLDLYQMERASGVDAYVCMLDLYSKDYDGRIMLAASDEKMANLEKTATISQLAEDSIFTGLDVTFCNILPGMLELRNPSKIYITNPFDGMNEVRSVNPYFYAKNIRNFTDELVFVSPYEVDEFDEKMERDYYNLKYLANTPGVTFAHKTLVQSEGIKQNFVHKLAEFAGANTKEIWSNKVVSKEEYLSAWLLEKTSESEKVVNEKKSLLYVISVGNILENPEKKAEKIKNSFETIMGNSKKINCGFCIYPEGEALPDEINDILDLYKSHKVDSRFLQISNMEELVKKYDAYYGDGSPFVPFFMRAKKPIMIAE